MEKNEMKENTHGTFVLGHLPVKKFTAVVTSEKLSRKNKKEKLY